jgi:CheY-like chemotaxis protein
MTSAPTATRHGKRILVVDDNEVIQDVLRELFGQDYAVDAVET